MRKVIPIGMAAAFSVLMTAIRMQAAEPDLDLVHNQEFRSHNPGYIEAVRQLISSSGYECPRLASLVVRGRSPYGMRLQALCGAADSDKVYPELHYAVYPDRHRIVVCKPYSFGLLGDSGCE